jgi:site-specific DNA-methyltransferase (adenine-specific)
VKLVPAIVERALSPAEERARAANSALREAEVQSAKADKRAEAARGAVAMRRRELGLALVEVRQQWPERGPKARFWGEYLAREGIEQSTAWRMMRDVGYGADDQAEISCTDESTHEIPVPRLVQPDDFDPTPQPPAALPRAGFNLRLGDWRSVLIDAGKVDTLITDHPYGKRTHSSVREGVREDGYGLEGLGPEYTHWNAADVLHFAQHWSPRTRGWMVALCSHDLIPAWETAYESVGRYGFAPVPCVINGMSVRLGGDGPSSWTVYAMVGRPRSGEFSRWGTLPGAYTGGREPGAEGGRGKPSWLMRALARDYSRPGDLICDPLAGYGATLIAALDEGRRCIGAELDHGAYDEAHRRAAQPRAVDNDVPTTT